MFQADGTYMAITDGVMFYLAQNEGLQVIHFRHKVEYDPCFRSFSSQQIWQGNQRSAT